MTPLMIPALFDAKTPKTPGDALFASPEGGRERSGTATPRTFSAYTSAQLHPAATAGIGLALGAGVAALLFRRWRR